MSSAGATIVVPARSITRATQNLAGLNDVIIQPLDLTDPDSIETFSGWFLSEFTRLDILINNAGIMACPLSRDSRGNELQLSANHLGHFHLTTRLWPALEKAQRARVVSVSSLGHQICGFDFSDPNFDSRTYDKWLAYGQSKTANSLFAIALDSRGITKNIRSFAVHPGSILTDLSRHLSDEDLKQFGVQRDEQGQLMKEHYLATNPSAKTIEQGAATQLWCAVSPELDGKGGLYCEDCNIAQLNPEEGFASSGVKPWAIDTRQAEDLWALSEKLTGVKFVA